MTNDELAYAIEQAWVFSRKTAEDAKFRLLTGLALFFAKASIGEGEPSALSRRRKGKKMANAPCGR